MKISQILSIALVAFALVACDQAKNSKESSTPDAPEMKAANTDVTTVNLKDAAKSDEGTEVKSDAKVAAFEWDETQFDFGDIQQGDVVEHIFKFKNTGEAPLVITDTKTTCGCTTPSFTKEPVQPGETGEILVKFNSTGKSGNTSKNITVKANVDGGVSMLRITTNILTGQAGPYKQ